jgi:predicted TIM-barrel fold metal-dependent hydrolase
MTGLKVYNQVKINDPLFYPIIEKFIELRMIILMHSHCGLGVGGKRTKYGSIQPNASIPEDFVDAAKRYPEAMFQYAHTGGGGDWEYACKAIKDYPNIYVDTSGSNNEGTMIDFALDHVGEDRLFFGTDSSYYQGVSGIFASKLNDNQKKKVLFDNYNKILGKSGRGIA